MTDLVRARPAISADVERTVSLTALQNAASRDERGGRLHLEHDTLGYEPEQAHAEAVAASDQTLIVGCIDGVVVGFARAGLHATRHARLCMIDELIVHPSARAIGVGSAMLESVREWATSRGCEAIESQVLPGNRAAKNFFERLGMKTRKMRVSADL